MSGALPPHGVTTHEWSIPGHWDPGPHEYYAAAPPSIADAAIELSPTLQAASREALLDVSLMDRGPQRSVPAAVAFMIQAEALGSAMLDGRETSAAGLAKAEAGQPASSDSRAVTRAAGALAAHLDNARRAISLGAISAAHTRPKRMASGAVSAHPYRSTQIWTGGTDLWPKGADYVPPHPSRITQYVDDLMAFAARDDIDPLAQAAIAHAQVLSVQPFATDNARVARSLVNGILRRRSVTSHFVVPVSASLTSQNLRLKSAWAHYQDGRYEAMVSLVVAHVSRAATVSPAHLDRFVELPQLWQLRVRPRAGSASHKILPLLLANPVVNASEVMRLTGASQAAGYEAVARLADAGVLTRISPTRRETMWAALDVFEAAFDLVKELRRA